MPPPNIELNPYHSEYALETVKMIRESFAKTMSITHQTDFNTVKGHLNFFSKYNPKNIQVSIDTNTSAIVGCLVQIDHEIEQLYVHVDYQRMGIGSSLLDIAKQTSPNRLELFAFVLNTQAQAFYTKHNFIEKQRGVASEMGNPWATSPEQLADIRYVWTPT